MCGCSASALWFVRLPPAGFCKIASGQRESGPRKDYLRMIGPWAAIIVMVFVVSAICASVVAQTQSKGTPDTEKVFDRLPGLDKQLIDASADPCVDFSEYACGNFSKLYPIPSDRSGFGPGSMVAEYNQTVLHTMLEKAAAGAP